MLAVVIYATCLFTVSCSTVASVCLLRSRSVRENRHRLMGRQLWHLAAADVCFGTLTFMLFIFNIMSSRGVAILTSRSSRLDAFCVAVSWGYSVGFDTSMAVEAHLAVAFAAALFRCTAFLSILRRLLCLVWPIGIALATVETLNDKTFWRHGCANENRDLVGVSAVSASVLICIISYFCSLLRVATAGPVIRDRVLYRSQLFILVWIVCLVPNIVRVVRGISNPWYSLVSLHLFNLRGLFSTLLYFVQSHYVQRMRLRRQRLKERQGQRSASDGSENHLPREGIRLNSFTVAVGGNVSYVDVPPNHTAEAMAQSERDISALERGGQVSADASPRMQIPITPDPIHHNFMSCFEPGSLESGSLFSGSGSWPPPGLGDGGNEVRQGLNYMLALQDGLIRRDRTPQAAQPAGSRSPVPPRWTAPKCNEG
jgi:hypothetical protein